MIYRYALYAAIMMSSISAVTVSFALFEEDLFKLLSALAIHVPLVAPFFLAYGRYASRLDLIPAVGFAIISIGAVLIVAMLVDDLLLGLPAFSLFQLAKRFLKTRKIRYILSLFSIVTYMAGFTVLGSTLSPYMLLVLSGIVICNVAITTIGNAHERRKEIITLTTVGLNPDHLVELFIAEALIMGYLGGSIGYTVGLYAVILASLPIFTFLLSAGWMVGVILISTVMAIIATILPALKASMMATPSLLKRWWHEAPSHAGWPPSALTFRIPVKLAEDTVEDFIGFFTEYLENLESFSYHIERINELGISKPKPYDEKPTWKLKFKYFFNEQSSSMLVTDNELRVYEDKKTGELLVEFEINVVGFASRFYESSLVYSYLWRLASTYRRLALEWTLKKPNCKFSRK